MNNGSPALKNSESTAPITKSATPHLHKKKMRFICQTLGSFEGEHQIAVHPQQLDNWSVQSFHVLTETVFIVFVRQHFFSREDQARLQHHHFFTHVSFARGRFLTSQQRPTW